MMVLISRSLSTLRGANFIAGRLNLSVSVLRVRCFVTSSGREGVPLTRNAVPSIGLGGSVLSSRWINPSDRMAMTSHPSEGLSEISPGACYAFLSRLREGRIFSSAPGESELTLSREDHVLLSLWIDATRILPPIKVGEWISGIPLPNQSLEKNRGDGLKLICFKK